MFTRGFDVAQSPADRSANFGRLEGGRDKTFRPYHYALPSSGSSGGQGCKKGRLDGCLLPITLPVTVGLGENTAGTLNALVLVPASGGGWRPCSRGLLICTSLSRIRQLSFSQAWVDSHDPFSVFEAMVVIAFWQSRVRTGGTTPSTVAPESLLERLRSSRGYFRRSSFRGVAQATPAGVAPEPLEESLAPSRVMLPFGMETLSISPFSGSCPLWKRGFGPRSAGSASGS